MKEITFNGGKTIQELANVLSKDDCVVGDITGSKPRRY